MERGRAGFARRPTGGFPTLEQEGSVREGGGVAGKSAGRCRGVSTGGAKEELRAGVTESRNRLEASPQVARTSEDKTGTLSRV